MAWDTFELEKLCHEDDMLSLVTVCFSLASGANAQDVRYNFDKNTDFNRFKTYKWVALKDAAKVDNLRDKQIKEAVDSELATKGLQKVDDDSANLFIGYQAGIGQEKQLTSYNTDWGYGVRLVPWWLVLGQGGTSTTTGQTSTIYTGAAGGRHV